MSVDIVNLIESNPITKLNGNYQSKLVEKVKQKSYLWMKFEGAFTFIEFTNWDQFYYRLYYGVMPPTSG